MLSLQERLRLVLSRELEIYSYRAMSRKTGIPWTLLRDFHKGKRDLKLAEADLLLQVVRQRITIRNLTSPS